MSCGADEQLQRYHDRALPPAEREALEAHLQACAACRQALAELLCLSELIVTAPRAELPAETLDRLRHFRPVALDGSVLRAAAWLTAAAAAVLFGALLIRFTYQHDAMSHPPIWQTLAVTPPFEGSDGDGDAHELVVARWMADDLSAGEVR